MRLVKYAAPLLAVAGLFLLAKIGREYGRPVVRIAELGRHTNFAQVELNGMVGDQIRFYAADPDFGTLFGSIEFEIDDGTGILKIRCYEETYKEIFASGKIPGFGDLLKVTANYQFKGKKQFAILNSAEDMQISRWRPAAAFPILTIAHDTDGKLKEGQRVRISGKVAKRENMTYNLLWEIEDPQGWTTTVNLSKSVLQAWRLIPDEKSSWPDNPKKGDYIKVFGALSWYEGRNEQYWQVVPAAPDEIVKIDEETWKRNNGQ